MILLLVGIGLALIVGLVSHQRAGALVGGLLLLLVFGPVLASFLDHFPAWLLILIAAVVVYKIVHAVGGAVLGRGVSDHLLADLLRGLFLLPFRIVGFVLGAIFRRRPT